MLSSNQRLKQVFTPTRFMAVVVVLALLALSASAKPVPSHMSAVQASGAPCGGPQWSCLTFSQTVPVPQPGQGQLLLKMRGSSVSPLVIELVDPRCKKFPPPFACSNGTIGLSGGAGIVAALGPGCEEFSVGDEVWSPAAASYAQYATASCLAAGLKPKTLGFAAAGASLEGVTSLQCLQKLGAPWQATNLTIAITAGQGGTGVPAIQLARKYGASHVVTAATGAGILLVKSLGADEVFDYHKVELFDALPDNSVDVVFDNLGAPGSADKAMRVIRPGGIYLVLTGGGGDIAKHPKSGVHQMRFEAVDMTNSTKGLDLLAPLFDSGALSTHVFENFTLADVAAAFNRYEGNGVIGKIAISI